MKRILCILLAAILLLTGCAAGRKESTEPVVTEEPAVTEEPVVTDEPAVTEEPTAVEVPVSGKYCVLGVDGERTYPERTALKFDFENMKFDFGRPNEDSWWTRRGDLYVYDKLVMAVDITHKTIWLGGETKELGNWTWFFELKDDGTMRFLPNGSDYYEIYGTNLTADSVLVKVGDLDSPIE